MLPISKEELREMIDEAKGAQKETTDLEQALERLESNTHKARESTTNKVKTKTTKDYTYFSTGPLRDEDFE